MATISEGLKYPFTNIKRLFNIWWLLVPIWGWFVVNGYGIRILKELVKGNTKELPPIHPFKSLFKTGFLLTIALLIVYIPSVILSLIPVIGLIISVYLAFIFPLLEFQFAEKQRIRDGVDIVQATKTAFAHFREYLLAYFKTIVVGIIFVIASLPIITIIVTFPALVISQYYFFAEYYKTFGKERK